MEAEERPKAFEELGRRIQMYMKIVEAYKAKVCVVAHHLKPREREQKLSSCASDQQEEQYDHLDEMEVTQVDKQVSEAMIWMNSKLNQQKSHDLALDPVVKVGEIQAKAKVIQLLFTSEFKCYFFFVYTRLQMAYNSTAWSLPVLKFLFDHL